MSVYSIHYAANLINKANHLDPVSKQEMKDPVTLKPCGHVMDWTTYAEHNQKTSLASKIHAWVPGRKDNYCPIDGEVVKEVTKNEALAVEIRIIQLVPAETELQCQEGQRLMKLGRFEEASDCFIRVISLNPEDTDAKFYLDFCLARIAETYVFSEKDDAEALYNLGKVYERGIGTDPCMDTAIKFYSLAAKKAYAPALYKMAKIFNKNKKLLSEFSEKNMIEWLSQAAKQGYRKAAFKMGERYENGQGVTRSIPDAIQMYSVAEAKGKGKAAFRIAQFYDKGEGVKQSGEKALEWYQKAAQRGHAYATLRVAEMYDIGGNGVSQSDEEALQWYKKAGSLGISHARDRVCKMQAEGRGVVQDSSKQQSSSVWNVLSAVSAILK